MRGKLPKDFFVVIAALLRRAAELPDDELGVAVICTATAAGVARTTRRRLDDADKAIAKAEAAIVARIERRR